MNMLEIRVHGRGGQGAQVACQMLADAFFRTGAWVQAFAAYGGERRGAPVTANLRVASEPVGIRCDIERPDHLLVLDATLLTDHAVAGMRDGGVLVVNGGGPVPKALPAAVRVVAVDAAAIARRAGLGPIVSTAMVGAFAAVTGLLPLAHLAAAVEALSPARKPENVAACRAGWEWAERLAPAGR